MATRDTGKRKHTTDMTLPADSSTSSPSSLSGSAHDPAVRLEADLQAHIGRQLRAVYDEVVNEPVPDKFVRLLEELERKRANGS